MIVFSMLNLQNITIGKKSNRDTKEYLEILYPT